MDDVNNRPNIRIEIQNNVGDAMEVDEETINISEEEEGEISDKAEDASESRPKQAVSNTVDIWAKFDNGISTTSIKDRINETKSQVESVYESLNIKELQGSARLNAVHMLGTGEMTTIDILKYFLAFSPTAIEWIDENRCNILWTDVQMSARALYQLSKAIIGSKEDGSLEETMDLDGQNNGMQNKHRVIEIADDNNGTEKENNKQIHYSDIKETIPEGKWRLGNESMKSKFILLRFALQTDPDPTRAEDFTEYYKQFAVVENGNENNVGLVSQSRKRKLRGKGIFDRNRDLSCEGPEGPPPKDPWGPLAESWYQDHAHTEPEYRPATLLTSKRLEALSHLQHRLGYKRAHLEEKQTEENNEEDEETIEIKSDEEPSQKSVKRTKKKKKTKIPRMRMYADEEEAKIKRKKTLQSIKKKMLEKRHDTENDEEVVEVVPDMNDLRNVLGNKRVILKPKRRLMENVIRVVKQEEDGGRNERNMEDLGARLKHRHLLRLSQAAEKNSTHLRLKGVNTVSTRYEDQEDYDLHEAEPLRRTITSHAPPSPPQHHNTTSTTPRSPIRGLVLSSHRRHHDDDVSRSHGGHYHRSRDGRDHREQREDYHRSGRHEVVGRMRSDRVGYGRGEGEREDSGRSGRRRREGRLEEEERARVERKGARSKVMVVVKKQHNPSVPSMVLTRQLPPPTPTALSSRHHDNARLIKNNNNNNNNQSSSSSSSSSGSSSSSSSASSSGDDNDSSSGSSDDSDSDSSTSTTSSGSDSDSSDGGRRGRVSVKDRVGVIKREGEGGNVRVKNERFDSRRN